MLSKLEEIIDKFFGIIINPSLWPRWLRRSYIIIFPVAVIAHAMIWLITGAIGGNVILLKNLMEYWK